MTQVFRQFKTVNTTFVKSVSAVALSAGLVVATPQPVAAKNNAAKAVGALLLICALGACKGGKAKAGGGGGGGGKAKGPADAVAMTRDQKRMIQSGLASLGYYSGSIDGLIGRGTRTSIRNWQSAVGYPVTGVLTGAQINELMLAAPAYASLPPDDVRLFEAEIARDLDRDGIRRLQALLNEAGYNAGPVDGAWGGKTRRALAAYKADKGLPGGPVPTERVIAVLEGRVLDAPAGAGDRGFAGREDGAKDRIVAGGLREQGDAVYDESVEVAEDPVVAPAAAIPLEIAGMRLGMIDSDFADVLEYDFDGDFAAVSATAADFGGTEVVSQGQLWTQSTWPAPGSEQIITLFDGAVPEYGAVAVMRTVVLPDAVTQEVFDANILPDIIEAYGAEARLPDTTTWIGDQASREAATLSPSALEACGEPKIASWDMATPGDAMTWTATTGPKVDKDSLMSVKRSCGNVLHVEFEPGHLTFVLWDSDYLADRAAGGAEDGAVVPKIKF